MSKQISPDFQQQFIEICLQKCNYGEAMFFLRSTENLLKGKHNIRHSLGALS